MTSPQGDFKRKYEIKNKIEIYRFVIKAENTRKGMKALKNPNIQTLWMSWNNLLLNKVERYSQRTTTVPWQ